MQALNYLYFLIITFLGIKFLYSKGVVVRHPLDRTQQMLLDGPEMFWVLTFSTGLLAFSAEGIGVDLMALRLMVLEVFCFLGLFVAKHRPVWSLAVWAYVVYLMWIIIGCFYSSSFAYGIRTVLKYLFPFLLMLFASAAVRHAEVFLKAGLGALWVALACLAFNFIPGISLFVPGVFWYGTAAAINFISIMVFCLTLYYFTNERRKYLLLAMLFLLPCFIWVFRTSIMGSIVALSGFYFIKYRFRSLPIIAGILVAGVIAVFTIPSLHQKMFKKNSQNLTIEEFQEGEVTMDNVETNAREAMWENAEKRFYKKHPIIGAGTGNLQRYMYHDFGDPNVRDVIHSDFVQQKCDNGLIGLILYDLIAVCVFLHCLKTYHSTDSIPIQMCALTAGASIIGVYATLYSDNVVNYSMATLSMPFGFYGMLLGLLKAEKSREWL